MKNELLKQIINQIRRYDLINEFKEPKMFKEWAAKLNSIQINNFIKLDIDIEEIQFIKYLLINTDLLNCNDYKQRILAISKLKNGQGCWHLFKNLCKPNFLKSKKFYQDIEMISKADTARYALWVVGNDEFINSKYHDEDLKLIVETHDITKVNSKDYVVSDALAKVASNADSINSPYHRLDMYLIAKMGSGCLQTSNTYPEQSLNNLAINKVSLKDIYHLENMQILATNPIASEFLYIIMTTPEFINGENYRKEVDALVNAKSKHTARAIYYYITNPKKKFNSDYQFYDNYDHDIEDASILNTEYISGKIDPEYTKNLKKINQIADDFVMHYVSLLMNPNFIKSKYKNFDLELLQTISNKSIFMDLYRIMSDKDSLNGSHHKNDLIMISSQTHDVLRNLLINKAINEYSINSINHEYDMKYISKLDIDIINKNIYDEICYYLFNPKGIDHIDHRNILEKLAQGIIIDKNISLIDYLTTLEKQIDNCKNNSNEIIESMQPKEKNKILNLFKKYKKK